MSLSADQPTQLGASFVWQQLSERIDAFISAWESADAPPELAAHLPVGPPALRQLTLVEAIKVDLEYRWKNSAQAKLVEAYLSEFPELAADGGVPCDLIYEEFHVRRQHGDTVSVREYCDRFPTRAAELRRLIELEAPEQTSSLMPTERAPALEAGQQIDDFDLLSSLGKGAFATVFLARQRSMQRLVALKVSRDRGSEPQTLAQLDHPHIVRVYDQRLLPDRKLRLLYMQYVAGGTLRDVVEYARDVPAVARTGRTYVEAVDQALAGNGEQPPGDSMTRYRLSRASWSEAVCWLGARLAGALHYAHERGVLHRDVKPANVLVGSDGQPRLADFNISFSKLDGATPAAYFGGSLAYMSPEQLEACDPAHSRQPDALDGRSDVYSLGVLLWELLTGKRPFAEDGLPATWSQMLPRLTGVRRAGVPPAALEGVPRDCPPGVVEVLQKCLSPEVADRHATAAELARDLDLCLQPRARNLLYGRGALTSLLKSHPVASTVAIGLIPNLLLTILNIAYNWQEIVRRLSPNEQHTFSNQIMTVNSIAYGIGLGYVVTTRGRMLAALLRLARGEKLAEPPSLEMKRRCLSFGAAVAMITAALWAVSGFIFPAWMQFGAGAASQLEPMHYAHFIVSNLLCGMIAATQSYYVVTFLALRYCYPWLLSARAPDANEAADLAALVRRSVFFLAWTVSVPFLALGALVLINFDRPVMGALGLLGLFSCGFAYVLDLTIRADVSALAAAINPSGDALASSDSFDSLVTGSRR